MSFSSTIKEELSAQKLGARHCRIAETAAMISVGGAVFLSDRGRYRLKIQTENRSVARKYFTLLKKTFNIDVGLSIRQNMGAKKSRVYLVYVNKHEDAVHILQTVRMWHGAGSTGGAVSGAESTGSAASGAENAGVGGAVCRPDGLVVQQTCCKRAFLRGAFLAAGSVSDPKKFYHLEFTCADKAAAEQIRSLLTAFDLDARIIPRKKYFVVYLKEGDQIADALNVMGAHNALMAMENVRIMKDMRNTVNRKVNCETANIHKTVSASVRQIEDIRYIRDSIGFGELPETLAQMAQIRLDHPDATLKELGMLLTPQVGKSGVNHRLRKLCEIAGELRASKGGEVL